MDGETYITGLIRLRSVFHMFQENSNLGIFKPIIGSWYESLRNPENYQASVLSDLVRQYSTTRYGQSHSVSEVKDIADFRANFPIINYKGLSSFFAEVMKGCYDVILPEPVLCWVMTRGSTSAAKVLPATSTHIEQIFTCGARALVNYALRKNDFDVFKGKILNLNFPSNVHTMIADGREVTYGYSSGTYARLNPMLSEVSLLPRQEEIDALGPGITKRDWENRFELAYQRALDADMTAAMGVTPIILGFARYVKKKHGKKPGDLWKLRALFCTSVRKIQFKYAPKLRMLYGEVPVVEIYSATEGVFGQQLDDLPYISPNYDKYFLEVETSKGIKMLHELKRGEWGKLLVSSCMFPRYDIGDLIEAAGKSYFRVFGRDQFLTRLEHQLYRLLLGWLT
ncbi:MAG: GH3 auxin-responsive promoter family protein [Candidatus Bathyarchaeota archaeon]|nr:GH3 auxin-responsive promoter family protein [Candidatus Bathyarchaeota archaeon]MDH5787358.1 GH3 auxin-responsive promoter family protein [Candidatus Bathyarchaeota archaeon]